jgi:hypothetical protein
MRNSFTHKTLFRLGSAQLLVGALALAGGVAQSIARPPPAHEDFRPDTPYSKVMKGTGDAVCWNVKRAFLSQGYILDRSSDSVVLTGTKDAQRDPKTNTTIRLQATCVDNKDGTSTVFASAAREVSKLQKVRQGWSAGVSIATVTVPTGSENVLQVISREAIQDPKFYEGFYTLVQNFVAGDNGSRPVEIGGKRPDGVADKGDKDDKGDQGGQSMATRAKQAEAAMRDKDSGAGDKDPQGAAAGADRQGGDAAAEKGPQGDAAGDKDPQ